MPLARGYKGASRTSAGQRDKWVEIEQQPAVPDGGGYPTEAWTSLGFSWMSKTDLKGDEKFSAEQDLARLQSQWQMPYQADMDPEVIDVAATRRLKYRGRIYNILASSLMEFRRGIEFITVVRP